MDRSKDLKTPFFTILFIFVGLFVYTKLAGPIPFYVNNLTTTKSNLFEVSGTGKESAVPDTADISLGITQDSPTVETGKTKVDQIMNKLTQDLKNLGVDPKNIQTTDYSVGQAGPDKTGYTVSQNISVKVTPIEKANKVIDISTSDGANQIGGVNFVLNDQTQKDLENKARIKAVQDAKQKAQNLAQAAGIKLGKIVDIQETPNGMVPLKMGEASLAQPSGDQASLNPGQTNVEITVTLSFETF